jgi:CDP-diacylglycerol--glycerol-3-phosphate 3-phosphatidyltransferase
MGEFGAGRADLARQRRWTALHHGICPAEVPLLLPFLRVMWRLAAPLAARGVRPTAVTAAGVGLAAAAVGAAARRPGIAAALVPAAALCDGLDGAIAVCGDGGSCSGARADAVADRLVDIGFATVLWRCGAPRPVAVAAAAVALGVDALRRARRVPARITVAERPSWAVCATLTCVSAARTDARWPVLCCAGVWLGLGAIGLGQVATGPPGVPSTAVARAGARCGSKA